MSKIMKQIGSAVLAVFMTMAMTVTAFAAATETTYSITINSTTEGHTYEAYQIFAGDLADGKLSNIVWGTGVTSGVSALGDAVELAEGLETTEEAAAFAKNVASYLGTASGSANVSGTSCVISGLGAGYYLVQDQAGSLTGDNASYTSYIMEVVGDVTATPKSDMPTVEKKVQDINDSTETAVGDLQDSADYDIGDTVPFTLTATLPSNVSVYNTYKVVFHDNLSGGLTYNNDFKVMIGENDVTSSFTAVAGDELTFTCNDVKAAGASDNGVITVTYTATLNESAVVGATGNPNTVSLEYSNNPNVSGTGENGNETGETPEDKVIVFTYKVDVTKLDQDEAPLAGATFALYKKDAASTEEDPYVMVSEIPTTLVGENYVSSFLGVDDGDYVIREIVTPAGYNTIADQYFTVSATHDADAADPTLTELSGNVSDGNIVFTPTLTEGSLATVIVNKAGSILPTTGGIGTTIFYTVGGILIVGAGTILVTKKRIGKKNK